MESLDQVLKGLPARHRTALQWFIDNAGTEQSWPKPISAPEGETLLVAKAKGIYKPEWTTYALSIRQNLKGPYPDRDPIFRPDGTWLYPYYQENEDPESRDLEYTNRGLIECQDNGIPIGVLRQISDGPSLYKVLGVALVSCWDGGYFYLEGFSPSGQARPRGAAGQLELLTSSQEGTGETDGSFDPHDTLDARERTVAQIVRRRGQPKFRRELLVAYENRCAVTGCDAMQALEAAHIQPFKGSNTNNVQNGLLLRSDIHTLFDLGLLSIDADHMVILLAHELRDTDYSKYRGSHVRVPADSLSQPSAEALRGHRQWCGL